MESIGGARRSSALHFAHFGPWCPGPKLAVHFCEGKRDKEFHPFHAVVGTAWNLKQGMKE